MEKIKVLYFDVETTGLEWWGVHDIIQIAGMIEIDGVVKEEFEFKCQPFSYENISDGAINAHGITVETMKTFQSPQEMYGKLLKIFDKYIYRFNREDKFCPAGQNVNFDLQFLSDFFRKNGNKYFGSYCQWRGKDLLELVSTLRAEGLINPKNLKLKTIADLYNVKFEKEHDALEDIRVTRKLLKMLIPIYLQKVDYPLALEKTASMLEDGSWEQRG